MSDRIDFATSMKAVVIVSIAILVSLGGRAETRPDFEDALRKANSPENAHLLESVNSESLYALTTARPGDMDESNSTRTPPEPNSSSPTPAPVDIYDWYQIGEYMDYMDCIGNLRFYRAPADTLEDTYNVLNQLLVKVHCSDQTLDEFKQVVGFFKSLPLKKELGKWTEQEKKKWQSGTIVSDLYLSVLAEAKKQSANVFLRLGADALELAWTIPWYRDNNRNLKSALFKVANEFSWIRRDSVFFSSLNPDAADAIDVVAKLMDKLGGINSSIVPELTDGDVMDSIKSGRTIRSLAQQRNLLR
jgi:hypothetical protein